MASLEPGKRLADRYVLLERLGDGGHAEVWSAQDETRAQRVALKVLHLRSFSADEAALVLQHEAGMAHRLEHPGVLRVDAPQRDGWIVFLPIEYAGGGDASQLRGATWQKVLPVLMQVAQVLEHAHSRGVVHRDIKPGNVLFDATGAVRVTDFGASSRTGSTAAMSAGSPFSASPQQLRGEAATTADDVYGLGALAYELLTRYPPFYPDFDLQRVQHEEPARPVPAQSAPAGLLDFILRMLARDTQSRPDLQHVMQYFDECLALSAGEGSASMIIEAAATQTTSSAPKRNLSALWWPAAAAGIAAAAILLLPRIPQATLTPGTASTVAPASVAAAVVVQPEALPATAPAAVETPPAATVEDALQAATAALAAGQPAQARAAFQRALALDAGNAQATQGLAAVAVQESLLLEFAAATRLEASGDVAAARVQYQAILAKADFAPARAALSRVQQRQRDSEFEQLLAQAALAERQQQWDAAVAGYERAAAFYPREARVLAGQERVSRVLREQRDAQDAAQGVALEGNEKWSEAVAHYQAVLARDASLEFAQDGLTRSERRASLDSELADYLARSDRLTAPAVRAAAELALARGADTTPATARLRGQLTQLRAALQAVTVPVRVAISSDNSTEISLAPVGPLGVFRLRELNLAPGRYTVIGTREGFRDVRLELDLQPGQRDASLSVQCTERI